jgi:hypothetical protein
MKPGRREEEGGNDIATTPVEKRERGASSLLDRILTK